MDKTDKCFIAAILLIIIGLAIMQLTGCANQIKPKLDAQLTKQELRDVIAEVIQQSSQNGLFNFQLNQETGSTAIGLGLLVYAIGSLGKGSWRFVTRRKGK